MTESFNDAAAKTPRAGRIWVIDRSVDDGVLERLADARTLADTVGAQVGLLIIGDWLSGKTDTESLVSAGTDYIVAAQIADVGQNTFIATAANFLSKQQPRAVFASGDAWGRECACRLAARCSWRLVSPALMIRPEPDGSMLATALNATGKRARRVRIEPHETVVVTLRAGIGDTLMRDAANSSNVEAIAVHTEPESILERRHLPAHPHTADIRHVRRLVAGGRGLGSQQGFDRLRQIAQKLDAGIAASRAVVDAGWIEHDRQVGQTGKTVKPDLYIACGISGASHHLEGMSDSAHIVSINSDAAAPIHGRAHLALVADLYDVLDHFERGLGP